MAATVVAVCVVHRIRPDRGRIGRTALELNSAARMALTGASRQASTSSDDPAG